MLVAHVLFSAVFALLRTPFRKTSGRSHECVRDAASSAADSVSSTLQNRTVTDMAFVSDRRMDPRTIIMARAEAVWVDSEGTPHMAAGMLEDTSPGGACVRLKEPIMVGSKIAVKWRREQISGT